MLYRICDKIRRDEGVPAGWFEIPVALKNIPSFHLIPIEEGGPGSSWYQFTLTKEECERIGLRGGLNNRYREWSIKAEWVVPAIGEKLDLI